MQAVSEGSLSIHLDLQLGDRHLSLQIDVGESGNASGDLSHLSSLFPKNLKIGAEDFNHDLGGDSAQHVTEAVTDGLPDIDKGSGHGAEFFSDLGEDFGARTAAFVKLDIIFIHAHGHHVVIPLRPTRAATYTFDLRDALEKFDSDLTDLVGLSEGSAGCAGKGDRGAALIEGGKELFSHERIKHHCRRECHADESKHEQGSFESESEKGELHDFFHGANEDAIAVSFPLFRAQEERAEHGDHGQADHK